jgi:hypothetical protein
MTSIPTLHWQGMSNAPSHKSSPELGMALACLHHSTQRPAPASLPGALFQAALDAVRASTGPVWLVTCSRVRLAGLKPNFLLVLAAMHPRELGRLHIKWVWLAFRS